MGNLLHDLDILGILDSIDFKLYLPEKARHSDFKTLDSFLYRFNKEDEYSELLKINEGLKSKVIAIDGELKTFHSISSQTSINSSSYKYYINLEFSSKLDLYFSNKIGFKFKFCPGGSLIYIEFVSKNPKIPESKEYMKNVRLESGGKSALSNLIFEKKPISKFLLNEIETKFPEIFKKIVNGNENLV